jgi:hypothetical protein
MINLHEAYLKAKNDRAKKGLTRLTVCRDYGEFWGFYFTHPTKDMSGYNGYSEITVNKKTGDICFFNPIMDFDLWNKATLIPIDQFAEYSVAI